MHIGIILACVFLLGASALPQDSEATTDGASNPPSCRTAKGAAGACVPRERCDFGPNNIDFTLYAPRAYKRPCSSKEVCCPTQYIIVQDMTANSHSLRE